MKQHTKKVRRICLLLAILMLLPTLVACAGSGSDDGGNKGGNKITSAMIPDEIKHMEELDFGDDEVVIAVSEFTSAEIALESQQYITGPKRMGADKVMNEIFNRNDIVARTLNLYPRYVYTNHQYDQILPNIKSKVSNGGKDVPDLYIDQIYGLIRAQMEGYLMNVKNDKYTSHLDFGSKTENVNGWYNPYMNVFNFASDEKMYLLAGDYFMDVIRFLVLAGVNLNDFKTSFMNEGGTDLLYKTVEDGRWTVDQMRAWSDVVYRDNGSTPGKPDEDDYLGILCGRRGAPGLAILPSAGVSLYKISDDHKTYKVELDQKAVTAVAKWGAALYSKGAFIYRGNITDLNATFVKGNSLFLIGAQLFQLETEEFKNMADNKCVVPYPKAVATEPYRVLTHDNARVGGILVSTTKYEATTAWVQASTLASQKTLDSYYNEALKYKYGTEFGTALMMDLIYQNISYPYFIVNATIINTTNMPVTTQDLPTEVTKVLTGDGMTGPSTSYASSYESYARMLNEALTIYKARFDGLK